MNEKLVCPKCGKEIPSNANLCPSCGTRVKEKKIVETKTTTEQANSRKTIGVTCIIIAIIAVLVMLSYRVWLGGLIYLVAGGIAFMTLKSDFEGNSSSSMPTYVKKCIKEGDIWNKIIAIIVALIPIVVIVCTYCWITVDTQRAVEDMWDTYYY